MEVKGKVERIGTPQHKFGDLYTTGIKVDGKWYNSPLLAKEEAETYFADIEQEERIRLEVEKNEKGFEEITRISKNGELGEEAREEELEAAAGIGSEAKRDEVELMQECIQMALDAWKKLDGKLPEDVFWSEVGATARTFYIENKRKARW